MNRNSIQRSILCLVGVIGLSICIAERTEAQSTKTAMIRAHQSWCQQRGGNWSDESCQWEELQMEQGREMTLSQECGSQNGIWHTWFEEVYNPKCPGGICLAVVKPEDFEMIEKGVVCAWYSGIDPAL